MAYIYLYKHKIAYLSEYFSNDNIFILSVKRKYSAEFNYVFLLKCLALILIKLIMLNFYL